MARVEIDGLKELRRDLRAMSPRVLPELRGVLKEGAEIVAKDASRRAPKGTRPIPASRRPRVRLAQSIKAGTSGASVFVRSRLPYANVQHFGGRVGHGALIPRARARQFITLAAEANTDEVRRKVGDGIEALARRHGWH